MFNLFSKKKQTVLKQEINDEVCSYYPLLVEAANIDEVFEEKEKNIIASIIEKQFKIKILNLLMKQLKRSMKV